MGQGFDYIIVAAILTFLTLLRGGRIWVASESSESFFWKDKESLGWHTTMVQHYTTMVIIRMSPGPSVLLPPQHLKSFRLADSLIFPPFQEIYFSFEFPWFSFFLPFFPGKRRMDSGGQSHWPCLFPYHGLRFYLRHRWRLPDGSIQPSSSRTFCGRSEAIPALGVGQELDPQISTGSSPWRNFIRRTRLQCKTLGSLIYELWTSAVLQKYR